MSKESLESPAEESKESEKEESIEPHHVESGFHHMLEAEKVKQNPKLLAKIKEHAKKHGHALSAIQSVGESGHAKSTKDLRELSAKMGKK